MAKECNMPDCSKTVQGRGLCSKHYYWLTKGRNPAQKAEVEKYAAESVRPPGGDRRARAPITGESTLAEVVDGQPEVGDSVDDSQPEVGDPVGEDVHDGAAMVNVFAEYLGLSRMRCPGDRGVIYGNPSSDKYMLVSPEGRLHPVQIKVGNPV